MVCNDLRWAVLGTARTAWRRILPALNRTPGHKCVAIVGRDPEKLQRFARHFEIAGVFCGESPAALLNELDVDVVYIPLPNGLHSDLTIAALEAGKHVLCEKPLALSAEAARRLISAQKAVRKLVVENFSYALAPGYQFLERLNRDKSMGGLLSLQVVQSFLAGSEHAVRFDRRLGGGCLNDLACYGIDFAHRLLGSCVTSTAVSAQPLTGSLATAFSGPVEALLWCRLRSSEVEVRIFNSFLGPRQQSVTLVWANGSCILPSAFLQESGQHAVFYNTFDRWHIKELPSFDQDSAQIQFLGDRIRSDDLVDDTDHRRWLANATVLEELRLAVDRELEGE